MSVGIAFCAGLFMLNMKNRMIHPTFGANHINIPIYMDVSYSKKKDAKSKPTSPMIQLTSRMMQAVIDVLLNLDTFPQSMPAAAIIRIGERFPKINQRSYM